jgi:chorismate-pyruvate lyase
VTHILEAYAGERIEVVKLLQEYGAADEADLPLQVAGGAKVLRRRVLLRGRSSRRNLLYAEVTVVPDRVDETLLGGLVTTDKPVGVLLAENRTETFREILVAAREPAGTCAAHFGIEPTAVVIFRTYRIHARQVPIMLITEKFPEESFRGLPA